MSTYDICFSPTGGTKKVSEFLSNQLNKDSINIDLTDRKTDFHDITLTSEDIAIIAVPSYGGRVPSPAIERIKQIQGNGAKTIIVCVYGNRAYDDTLVELLDCAQQAGFLVIAAVAAIAKHSIANRYATNRPDVDDYKQLHSFAELITEKLHQKNFTTPFIPGNRPYKTAGNVGIVPHITNDCTKCGVCASLCPVGAIDQENPAKTDKKICISCMRCVNVCPHNARKVNKLILTLVNMMLKKACSTKKECELYI